MKIEPNKVVEFHYTVRDKENGQVYDSSVQRGEPIRVLMGANQIIPGLERQLMGMEEGQRAVIEVPAEEAYGQRNPEMVQALPREYFQGIELEKGLPLQATTPEGHIVNMVVLDFNDKEVVVDFNHPLAGRDLVFEVEILKIREATPEELAHGHAH
jgi:FKBP-type peptidyl-prolyl cis-trans isomerase SlyD